MADTVTALRLNGSERIDPLDPKGPLAKDYEALSYMFYAP